MKFIMLFRALFLFISTTPAAADDKIDINNLEWLAGEWVGEGREGVDGNTLGCARLYWIPPTEGVASFLFTWHSEESAHIHHALTIFKTDSGVVTGKGIHFGRDFQNFEEQPWELMATRLEDGFAEFLCTDYCRSDVITYKLSEDGELEERGKDNDGSPDWIVTYRKVKR